MGIGVFLGQPRHCICTNASRGLSATAEFLYSRIRTETRYSVDLQRIPLHCTFSVRRSEHDAHAASPISSPVSAGSGGSDPLSLAKASRVSTYTGLSSRHSAAVIPCRDGVRPTADWERYRYRRSSDNNISAVNECNVSATPTFNECIRPHGNWPELIGMSQRLDRLRRNRRGDYQQNMALFIILHTALSPQPTLSLSLSLSSNS